MHGERRTVAGIDPQAERPECVIDLSPVWGASLIVAVEPFTPNQHANVGCVAIDHCPDASAAGTMYGSIMAGRQDSQVWNERSARARWCPGRNIVHQGKVPIARKPAPRADAQRRLEATDAAGQGSMTR